MRAADEDAQSSITAGHPLFHVADRIEDAIERGPVPLQSGADATASEADGGAHSPSRYAARTQASGLSWISCEPPEIRSQLDSHAGVNSSTVHSRLPAHEQ